MGSYRKKIDVEYHWLGEQEYAGERVHDLWKVDTL